jgi:acyl carrier protein
MSIEEKVKEIVARQLGAPVEKITPETLLEKLGADLLDIIDLTISIENLFHVYIPDEEAEEIWRTVGDAVRYIEDKVGNRAKF